MFLRVDLETREVRRWRCRSCVRLEVTSTVRLRVVECVRVAGRGPRQRTLVRLPAVPVCCAQEPSFQGRFWEEVRERLEGLAGIGREEVRGLLLEVAEKVSCFLGEARPLGEAPVGARILARGVGEDGRWWVRAKLGPDLARWHQLPEELGRELVEAARVLRAAGEVARLGPRGADAEWARAGLASLAELLRGTEWRAALRRLAAAPRALLRKEARRLAERARRIVWCSRGRVAVGARVDWLAAFEALRQLLAKERAIPRSLPAGVTWLRGAAARGGRRRSRGLEGLVWELRPERALVVASYAGGSSLAEAGRRLRPSAGPAAARARARRHLEAFCRELERWRAGGGG